MALKLGLRGLARHAGGEARPHRHRVVVPHLELLVDRERHPHLEVGLQEVEAARQHPDDRERLAVDEERLADDARVAAVAALPQPVGQDDDPVPARHLLLGQEGAAHGRPHAEHREERRRDADAADLLGDSIAAHRPRHRVEPVAPPDDVVERPALRAPVEEVARRRRDVVVHRPALRRVHVADAHEAIDVRERRRAEEEVVGDREDGGGRADPEGEGQHRDEREAGVPPRAAQRVADVADEVLQGPGAARIPHRLLDGVDAAQARARPAPRLARVHARAQVLLGFHLQVESQLVLRLGVLAPAAEEAPQPPDESRDPSHFVPPAQFSTPFTAFTVRSHSARSASICRRPTSVRK